MTKIKTLLLISSLLLFTVFFTAASYSNWEKIDYPAGFENVILLDIMFLTDNPQIGWVCGYNSVVMKTTDGGDTWAGQNALQTSAIQLEHIQFLNENIGYTSGSVPGSINSGYILKSTDGGETWFDISPQPREDLWGCYFVNEGTGVVLGGTCANQYFYSTTDGGNSWFKYEQSVQDTKLSDAILYEDGTGWATSSGIVWKTDDWGRTWTIAFSTGNRDWQEELTYYNGSFLVPWDEGCSGVQGDNGGMRFVYNNSVREFNSGNSMYGTFLLDEVRGWACGSNGSIFYTSDAGNSWELKDCGINGADLDDIWFINDTLGFVVGNGIFRTVPFEYDTISVLKIPAENICIGDEVILRASREFLNYRWSNGATSREIKVDLPGEYSLLAFNSKCDTAYSESYSIEFLPHPEFDIEIFSPGPYCEGDEVELSVKMDTLLYTWFNGDTNRTVTVTKTGTYKVKAVNGYGCETEKNVYVLFNTIPELNIEIIGNTRFCLGDSVELLADSGFQNYQWYLDDTGNYLSSERNIKANSNGNYFYYAESDSGCGNFSDPVYIEVIIDSNLLAFDWQNPEFEFGDVAFPDRKCLEIEIFNTSLEEAIISEPYLQRTIGFSIPLGQIPISIPPLESRMLEVCFSPTTLGIQRDTLELPDNCSPHQLPLMAVSGGNQYTDETRCGLDVRLNTAAIYGKNFFDISPAFPNPANLNLSIPIIFAGNEQPVAKLYNSLGMEFMSGRLRIQSTFNAKEKSVYDADFLFYVKDLPQGLYFICILHRGNIYNIPVSIAR